MLFETDVIDGVRFMGFKKLFTYFFSKIPWYLIINET